MPVLDPKAFLRDVQAGRFPPVALLVGEEETLMLEALQKFQAAFFKQYGNANPEFNFEKLHGDRDGAGRIADACQTLPFGADKKLVIVQRLEKSSENAKESLAAYCAAPNPSTCLVLLWSARPNPATLNHELALAAARLGSVVKFWKLFEEQRPQWIREEARRLGKSLAADAAALLSQEGGETLAELASELEKCALFVGERAEIGMEDVRQTLSFKRNRSVWDLVENLERRNVREAGKILEHCLEQGEEPLKLLNLIARSCRKMSDGAQADVRSRDGLDHLFSEIKKTDLLLKSGQDAESGAFERLLALCESAFKR